MVRGVGFEPTWTNYSNYNPQFIRLACYPRIFIYQSNPSRPDRFISETSKRQSAYSNLNLGDAVESPLKFCSAGVEPVLQGYEPCKGTVPSVLRSFSKNFTSNFLVYFYMTSEK